MPTPADTDRLTAAILAGGRARRMAGADKASLPLGGRRFIDRQIAALREITDSILIVGGDAARFADLHAGIVGDALDGCGALGGLYTALLWGQTRTGATRVLVVACDMPFLSVPLLRRLADPLPPGVDVVMPRTRDGLQPLCAVYAVRCASAVRKRIDAGFLKACDIGESLRVEEIGPDELATYDPDGLMFVNVNTPHDYERAKEVMGRVPGSREMPGDRITDAAP